LPADLYATIQRSIPIACVDVVPLRVLDGVAEVLLIRRDTAGEGLAWCLVGGRLTYDESLARAVLRQIRSTLGEHIHVASMDPHPNAVVQYLPGRIDGGPRDPRQHALGLTFLVHVEGHAQALGEAHAIGWFDVSALPDMGFGQRPELVALLQNAGFETRA
jgi:ADP-ribose pyrophosphatase YjhB (NUDIX family)